MQKKKKQVLMERVLLLMSLVAKKITDSRASVYSAKRKISFFRCSCGSIAYNEPETRHIIPEVHRYAYRVCGFTFTAALNSAKADKGSVLSP